MVRKAETLKSLNGLDLPRKTRLHLLRSELSLLELVEAGRAFAFYSDANPKAFAAKPQWKIDLVAALDKAGYIRHDFYPKTYRAINLLRTVKGIENHPLLVNKNYESFRAMTDEEYDALIEALHSRLSELEYDIVNNWFGLDGGLRLGFTAISERYGISHEQVRLTLAKALRKLKYSNTIPPLLDTLS
ncbi:hypothetical protein J6V85_03055 [Candidatus Saccharibacteria bacterium]|nr:hypothetical protein [Candidatus Saccharibacteria bacterium]